MTVRIMLAAMLVWSTTSTAVIADAGAASPQAQGPTKLPVDRDPAPSMMQEVDIGSLPANELNDKPVYDSNNERVATVKEVSGAPGSPRQATLKTGGVLGVGGTDVTLPLDKLRVGPDGRLLLTMTESELKLLPRAE